MNKAKSAVGRRLILLRHAKSDWSGGLPDHERPLAERGRRAAPLVGACLAAEALVPDLVLLSPSRRTRETWEIVSGCLASPPPVVEAPGVYEAGSDALLGIVRSADPDIGSLMIVGHNPGLQDLALRLVEPSRGGDAVMRLQQKFPTAAVAVLDLGSVPWSAVTDRCAALERFVTPKTLA